MSWGKVNLHTNGGMLFTRENHNPPAPLAAASWSWYQTYHSMSMTISWAWVGRNPGMRISKQRSKMAAWMSDDCPRPIIFRPHCMAALIGVKSPKLLGGGWMRVTIFPPEVFQWDRCSTEDSMRLFDLCWPLPLLAGAGLSVRCHQTWSQSYPSHWWSCHHPCQVTTCRWVPSHFHVRSCPAEGSMLSKCHALKPSGYEYEGCDHPHSIPWRHIRNHQRKLAVASSAPYVNCHFFVTHSRLWLGGTKIFIFLVKIRNFNNSLHTKIVVLVELAPKMQ